MPEAVKEYRIGHGNKIFLLPQIKAAETVYSEEIAVIKQLLDGTDVELGASWPDAYYKEVVQMVLVDVGVVKKTSGKTHNPNRRLM